MQGIKSAALYSGGKDSTYACAKAFEYGHEIVCLLTMWSENPESYMLHTANIEVTKLSARAMGLPHFLARTQGKKEEELEDIASALTDSKAKFGFDTIITGAIASRYQRERIEKIAKELDLKVFSPLWGVDQKTYFRTLVNEGYRFILTSISAEGLDRSWLGREIGSHEAEILMDLSSKFGFNAAFEGGEAETLVLDCPIFTRGRIKILRSEVQWHGYFGVLKILESTLEEKQADCGETSELKSE